MVTLDISSNYLGSEQNHKHLQLCLFIHTDVEVLDWIMYIVTMVMNIQKLVS